MKSSLSFPRLATDRLILRQINPEDAEDLYLLYSDEQLTRYLDWNGPSSVKHTEEMITAWNGQYEDKRLLPWGITLKSADRIIGTIMLMPIRGSFEDKPLYPVNVGFELSRVHWHQGLMSEALEAVTRYGIEHIGAHRLQAEVVPENTASLKLLQKYGFEREGLLKQYLLHEETKRFIDVVMLAFVTG